MEFYKQLCHVKISFAVLSRDRQAGGDYRSADLGLAHIRARQLDRFYTSYRLLFWVHCTHLGLLCLPITHQLTFLNRPILETLCSRYLIL